MIDLPDRYELLTTIPGGGMSQTLHCRDKTLQRDVVIKALKPGIEPHRLLDELASLSAIRSKYVVEIYDVLRDSQGNVTAVIEEHLSGPALTACPTSYDSLTALKMLYPVAAGIADIHAHGRIHRDIKPENMKFDGEGQLNIFDFGLAKLATSPGTTALFFSQGYTAPEAFQLNASGLHTYTTAVDVYAFGCVAVWMLNGGSLPSALMTVPPTLPVPTFTFAGIAPVLPASVSAMLDRCLAATPAQRPSMDQIQSIIAAELLRGRHRLLLTVDGQQHFVDSVNPTASLSVQTAPPASITIQYDGLSFKITAFAGSVLINNATAQVGGCLTGSSVIVMGVKNPSMGQYPKSVTADVSHPEVTL